MRHWSAGGAGRQPVTGLNLNLRSVRIPAIIRTAGIGRPSDKRSTPARFPALLPESRRSGIVDDAIGVSPDEFAKWLTPQQALLRARSVLGNDAEKAIWERLHGGIVRTAALKSSMASPPNAEPRITETPNAIPARYWGHFSDSTNLEFWQTGVARFFFPAERKRITHATVIRCFDVRLHPTDVEASFPLSVIMPPVQETSNRPALTPTQSNKGGRPRKDWWDDFWIDICHQIYLGDLKPTKQADLEWAMHEWVTNHGHDAGETSIKNAARKLFKAWQLGGSKT
jgi:hypothetical protein